MSANSPTALGLFRQCRLSNGSRITRNNAVPFDRWSWFLWYLWYVCFLVIQTTTSQLTGKVIIDNWISRKKSNIFEYLYRYVLLFDLVGFYPIYFYIFWLLSLGVMWLFYLAIYYYWLWGLNKKKAYVYHIFKLPNKSMILHTALDLQWSRNIFYLVSSTSNLLVFIKRWR